MSAPGFLPETSITTSPISMYRSIPNPILRRCRACQCSVIGICEASWRPLRRLIRSLRPRTNRPRPMISCGTRSTVRSRSSAEAIRDVPGRASAVTSANYQVLSYKPDEYFNSRNRRHYFAEISTVANQVIFFDPDNGFEPEKSCENQHLSYQELQDVLERLSPHSVVTVFQYFRRMPFPAD